MSVYLLVKIFVQLQNILLGSIFNDLENINSFKNVLGGYSNGPKLTFTGKIACIFVRNCKTNTMWREACT